MEMFIFGPELATGVVLIDEQHKKMLEVANIFFVSFEHGHAKRTAPETLAFLEQFILYHFHAEEAYMVDSDYPDYREHQARHSYIGTQVKFHHTRLEHSNYSYEEATSFFYFFKDWITDHILNVDLKFATYYREFNKGAE